MQPGRKCRLAAKGCDLAIELQERLLGQVFGFGGIGRHPKTQRIDSPLMAVVQALEGLRVALLGLFDRLSFVEFVALSLSGVGQVSFSGRTRSDAANYLYVVWLARGRSST